LRIIREEEFEGYIQSVRPKAQGLKLKAQGLKLKASAEGSKVASFSKHGGG